MVRKILSSTAMICALMLAGAGVASAAGPTAYVNGKDGGGEVRGMATYDDSENKYCVSDRYGDYHSAVLQYKRSGASGWTVNGTSIFDKWDSDGADNGSVCVVANFAENTSITMRVCVGEWASAPRNRVILKNGHGGLWCGPAKTFLS